MPAAKPAQQTPAKMSTFTYECTNVKGVKVKGDIASTTITMAKADLRRQGLNPIKVRRKSNFALFQKKKEKN